MRASAFAIDFDVFGKLSYAAYPFNRHGRTGKATRLDQE